MTDLTLIKEFFEEEFSIGNIRELNYHVADGYFRIFFVAGKEFLIPLRENKMTHVYGAFRQLKTWIERYEKNENVRYIAGLIREYNDERPSTVLYYTTKGIE